MSLVYIPYTSLEAKLRAHREDPGNRESKLLKGGSIGDSIGDYGRGYEGGY